MVSILVVLDQAARPPAHGRTVASRGRFQSLLSWIRLLGTCAESCRACTTWCFNPCCLGSGCSASRATPGTRPIAQVSILVVLDQAARPSAAGSTCRHLRCVSILVVLDQAARPRCRGTCTSLDVSFNPCCLGSGCSAVIPRPLQRADQSGFNPCCLGSGCSASASATLVRRRCVSILVVLDQAARRRLAALTAMADAMFQSLLSWIRLLGPCSSPADCQRSRFQSLLSWIRLLGTGRCSRRADCDQGFNPCCLGSGCSACDRPTRALTSGFQSLLSWIRLLGRAAAGDVTRHTSGFNPCCLGSGCSAVIADPAHGQTPRFQSLLSWIRLLGLGSVHRPAPIRPEFQSLLSWIRLLGTARPCNRTAVDRSFNPCCLGSGCSAIRSRLVRPWPRSGFNPCCLGSGCSACEQRPRADRTSRVSILVVLDQAARPAAADSGIEADRRFQSLLSWIRLLGRVAHRRQSSAIWCFNPCCLGSGCSARQPRSSRPSA